jgi:hypothetical protein
MNVTSTLRDEKAIAAESVSYRRGFTVLSFGLLLATIYRSFVTGDASWDLLALVVAGGAATTISQASQHIFSARRTVVAIVSMTIAFVIAGMLAATFAIGKALLR